MKKLAASLLIFVLFFNWYGYRLLIAYWQGVAEHRLQTSLDGNDYDESSLISIKIPAAYLSYYNASARFERVDGEIIVGDAAYKYVKRRIINDSVELLCIRNADVIRLRQARDDFFQKINDLLHFPQSGGCAAKSEIQKVYNPVAFQFRFTSPIPVSQSPLGFLIFSLPPGHLPTAERPPDSAGC